MGTLDARGFAIIRKPEFDLIKTLSFRARMRAIALMAAIRLMHGGATTAAISDRDFQDFGLGRDAAGCALKDAVAIGLLEILQKGGLTGRGHKTTYRIVYARPHTKETAGKSGTRGGKIPPFSEETAGKPATNGGETRPFNAKAAGKSRNTKETSSTSSRKSQEEEVSSCASAAAEVVAAKHEADAEHEKRVADFRKRMVRIAKAADAIGMTTFAFVEKAGGNNMDSRHAAADFLARKFIRGELSANQLRAKLVESEAGSSKRREGRGSDETETSERVEGVDAVRDDLNPERQQRAAAGAGSPPVDFAAFGSPGCEISRRTRPIEIVV